ncbi:Uncharacterized protein YcnI [Amycolatopsis marina]|uniref:Uncharacterized protein YcnI n=1 Tax=Amycolatopsis marina TaxID=490629 RepID=A0A1I1CJL4_9PSEU|nr:YcnI family protein [Amycolatopsis marina]SFB62677.1 Uncharacterized protein YcnI [Amycolatopsis marina]
MSRTHVIRRSAVLLGAVGATSLLTTGIAAAHVTANVYGEQPEKGGYGAIVLRVPNEEAEAGTNKIEMTIPNEYAISSARTTPVPGWTAEVTTTTLPNPVRNGRGTDVTEVATKITWTAQPGNEIAAGTTSYEEFAFTAGPLPGTVDTLMLPVTQTYSNGTVANWDAPPPAEGAEEPENPAPVVELAAESGNGHGGGDQPDTADIAVSQDDTARWLGGAGVAVGALGLGVGAGALLRSRKAAKPTS